MDDPRIGKREGFLQHWVHPVPRHPTGFPTAPPQPFVPQLLHFRADLVESTPVAGDLVIGIVPLQLAHKCPELVEHPPMPVDATPVADCSKHPPQSFGRRFASNDPVAFPALRPVMGEAQKVERVRFMRRGAIPSSPLGPSEPHQAGLLRVECQPILLEATEDDLIDPLRIPLMRETDHQIIGKPHRKHPALRPSPHHVRKPAVEYFVQVDFGQNGGDDSALWRLVH